MANIITISKEWLEENSLQIYDGMLAVHPVLRIDAPIYASETASKFNGCYAVNNSTICFVSENRVFVTPYTRAVVAALSANSFKESYFYVPFSNGDYPKYEQAAWNRLREKAKESYQKDFIADCMAYCDEHHIGSISNETLRNCFVMPSTGVKVKHLYFEDCYYPVINSTCLDCMGIERIGRFCTNNGRVVFVYRDGKTYVAKGYSILSELRAAGYTESGLFVPFSNGEQIVDPVLRARWENITK